MAIVKPSQRLRRRAAGSKNGTDPSGAHSGLDTFLQRLAHLTQVGLLALGVFGYFYTVLPVFQNQQLQEQAAKLELEKSAAQRHLDELLQQQAKVSSEIALLRENWSRERARNAQLSSQVTTAREEELNAKRRTTEAELALASQLQALEAARWELVAFDFSFAHMFGAINSSVRNANRDISTSMPTVILEGGKDWPRPYGQLLEALEAAQKKRQGAISIPGSYYAELRSFIDDRQSSLQCTLPDFQALHASYQLQWTVLENSLDAETAASVEKLQKDYASKGQQVQITDQYRQSTRASLRAGKMFTLDQAFRKRVDDLRKECSEKASKLIEDFRKSKGIRG